jgi:MraZ protein
VPKGLSGSYTHKLDGKGRVVLPAKFRDELGQSVMTTIGTEKCIHVYSMEEWDAFQTRLSQMRSGTRNGRRLSVVIMASAQESEIDGSGRIMLPKNLRDYASITQDVSINGAGERLEIWDLAAWDIFWKDTTGNILDIAEGVGWL